MFPFFSLPSLLSFWFEGEEIIVSKEQRAVVLRCVSSACSRREREKEGMRACTYKHAIPFNFLFLALTQLENRHAELTRERPFLLFFFRRSDEGWRIRCACVDMCDRREVLLERGVARLYRFVFVSEQKTLSMASFVFPTNAMMLKAKSRLSTTSHQEDMTSNLSRTLSPSMESIATNLTFNDDEVSPVRERREWS